MALSGSFYGSTNNQYVQPKIVWSAVQSVSGNYTDVTATLYYSRTNSGYSTCGTWNGSITIDGTTVSGGGSSITIEHNSNTLAMSATTRVYHNADGTKTITISATGGMPSTSFTSTYISASASLDTIARASDFTVSGGILGSQVTVSISRASDSFVHEVIYKRTDGQEISCGSGHTTSCVFTPGIADSNLLPNATSGVGAVIVKTYSGSALIGSVSKDVTFYVPSTVVPAVSAFSVSPGGDNTVVNGWGIYVSTVSKAVWSAAAAGTYGASIVSYAFSLGGISASGASGSTGILMSGGQATPVMTVRDSRGRTATATLAAIQVHDYSLPDVTASSAIRCTEDGTESDSGTFLKLTLSASCASVGGLNAVSLRWRYKPVSGTFTGWSSLTSGQIVSGFDATASYVVELSAVDSLGGEKSVSVAIPTANVAFHLKEGGLGAAFGKYAEYDNLLDSAWPALFRSSLQVSGVLSAQSMAFPDLHKFMAGYDGQNSVYLDFFLSDTSIIRIIFNNTSIIQAFTQDSGATWSAIWTK